MHSDEKLSLWVCLAPFALDSPTIMFAKYTTSIKLMIIVLIQG